ncbi:hypothetical protein [Streptomyces jumonjinensis]|uniref:hypothetical protein n=1 Tax=Streptomyces jumonjinensis TaxID=1945 RepID=UPI003795DED3
MSMIMRRWAALLAVVCLAFAGAIQPVDASGPADPGRASGAADPAGVRGWTILSDSDQGADEVLAAAPSSSTSHRPTARPRPP